jgi:nicotinate-nucleotide adenylyltransferase
MQRIGICGGTFDPFHNAHFELVKAAAASGKIDRLLVIPAGSPPHKQDDKVMPAVFRYEMTRRAIKGLPDTEAVDIEITRPGKSYTIDTVNLIKEKFGRDVSISLIYGTDILFDIEKWHKPQEIMHEATLLLAYRLGDDRKKIRNQTNYLTEKYKAVIEFFTAPEIELSSTQVRSLIRRELPWQHLVPDTVALFIQRQDFYRFADDLNKISPEEWIELCGLERKLWPFLTKKRLLHSANVMLYAIHLANLYGEPAFQAAQAALLHDCAKCLDRDQLLSYAMEAGDQLLLQDELAHGPAGAVMAKNIFGINDPSILKAIHYHTTGYGHMSILDKLIYLTDKIEYGRLYDDLDPIREAAEYDLDKAMRICLNEVEMYLRRSNQLTHPYAQAAIRQVSV